MIKKDLYLMMEEMKLPYDCQIVKICNCSKCGKFVSLMNFEEDGKYPHIDAVFDFDGTLHASIYCSYRCAYGDKETKL